MTNGYRKKLIEVALPLEAINKEAAREKSIRHGHPSTLHLWWARRPLAACRAVLFASLVDDPSSRPEEFPTPAAQDKERQRLFRIIEELVLWESSNDERVLGAARAEILRSCDGKPPPVLDPFCGGGSIPLEAQRLGLDAYGSDLNPVAVLITKALIEIPPKFANLPPVNPDAQADVKNGALWKGAEGLADDVRFYGKRMRDEAEKRIGHLYPRVRLPKEKGGGDATVIAWLWARAVTCPNPACGARMPLVNSFEVARKANRHVWLAPVVRGKQVSFDVREDADVEIPKGTVDRRGGRCLVCEQNAPLTYVRQEGLEGRHFATLLCIVAEGASGRVYVPADPSHEARALEVKAPSVLLTELPKRALGFRVQGYGLRRHCDLFTARQLTLLKDLCDEAKSVFESLKLTSASDGYPEAMAAMLALGIGRIANRHSSQSFWDSGGENVQQVFARNALPMIWVYAEANPFSESSGNVTGQFDYLVEALRRTPARAKGSVVQRDAANEAMPKGVLISTDPPYYDNVPYADLSDFFYVWHREAAQHAWPELYSTVLTPKAPELIAEPARHESKDGAARFFEMGLRRVFQRIRESQHPDYPATVYYAFKQAETDEGDDEADGPAVASTGWETMLDGLVSAGLAVDGTWPMRTEQPGGLREVGRNALASSVVLVCRPRPESAPLATRQEFARALKSELPDALRKLQQGNIAPVDLAQAAIGPGMAIFSRYAKVLEPDGGAMAVRTALQLINQHLDAFLSEQESEFDPETRWAVTWFDSFGRDERPYGDAETLSKAKNVSVETMRVGGIVASKGGRVSLLCHDELKPGWDPASEKRVAVWKATHHLIRVLRTDGEAAASNLLRKLGDLGETARDLAYRLYSVCERRKWADDARDYNALVVAWPSIKRLAAEVGHAAAGSGELFG